MRRSIVGLNIGSYFMKVVELRSKRGGIEVAALGIAPTPEAALAAGEILQADVLVEALRELIREAGIRTKDTVVTIAGQAAVIVRVTDVPKMPPKEFASTMALEIEREVPFDPSSIRRDYITLRDLDEVEEGETVPVLYAAARSDVVDTYIDVLLKSGLNPIAVDVEPLAVMRALIDLPQSVQGDGEFGPNDLVVIVNIGAESSDLVVIHNGVITFPRIVPMGSDELTLAISDALGLDKTNAERFKQEIGTAWIEELMTAPEKRPPLTRESETMPVDELGMSEIDMGDLEHMTDGGTPADEGDEEEFSFELNLDEGQEFGEKKTEKSEGGEGAKEGKPQFSFELEEETKPLEFAHEQPTEPLKEEQLDSLPELELPFGEFAELPSGREQEVEIEEVSLGETEVEGVKETLVGDFDLNFGEEVVTQPTEYISEALTEELTLEGAPTETKPTEGFKLELEEQPTPTLPKEEATEGLSVERLEAERKAEEITRPTPMPSPTTPLDVFEEREEVTPTIVTARYIFEAIEGRLHDLATEIVRSVEYCTSKMPNAEVKLVYIIGGGARLKGLDKFLEYQLGVPVRVGNPFRYLELAPVISRYGQAYIDDIAPYMVVALGAALREML